MRETPVNEPLINWHSIDGDHALARDPRHRRALPSRSRTEHCLAWARRIRESEGLNVLPASTAGLAAFARRHARERLRARPVRHRPHREENMSKAARPEGNAIVYCEGAFGTTNGKTAHGLVRFTRRYRVLSVVDSGFAGRDAGRGPRRQAERDSRRALDRRCRARAPPRAVGPRPTWSSASPRTEAGSGGEARTAVVEALDARASTSTAVFTTSSPRIASWSDLAETAPTVGSGTSASRRPRGKLHFFSGKIEQVESFRVAVLGTDSAVGKRTTAWLLVEELEARRALGRAGRDRPDGLAAGGALRRRPRLARQRLRLR